MWIKHHENVNKLFIQLKKFNFYKMDLVHEVRPLHEIFTK